MFAVKALSFVSTALLLVWMYYFVVGGAPLLFLKHSVPNDSRMVRGFFDVHYRVAMGLSSVGAASFAIAERLPLAIEMAFILTFAFVARRTILPRLDRLRSFVTAGDAVSIKAFRRVQLAGFMANILLLAIFTWSVSRPSFALFTCVDVPPGCQGAECKHQCSL